MDNHYDERLVVGGYDSFVGRYECRYRGQFGDEHRRLANFGGALYKAVGESDTLQENSRWHRVFATDTVCLGGEG